MFSTSVFLVRTFSLGKARVPEFEDQLVGGVYFWWRTKATVVTYISSSSQTRLHIYTHMCETSNLKLGRRGKINSVTLSRRIFNWPTLVQS